MEALKTRPKRLRSPVSRGSGFVIRDGGDNQAGLIEKISVITRGEAAGHDMWVDGTFLGQVRRKINTSGKGIKARFTHPSLSGDGLGKFLGRVKNASVSKGRVLGDLHISESAQSTPDGDLADYIMTLAESDPEAFGVSIAFERNLEEEQDFFKRYSDGRGRFASPDPDNTQNYPHFRLADLTAVDAVDEPAANPDGLFHRGADVVREADSLLEFALDLSDGEPELVQLEFDPWKIKHFLHRFLDSHNLEIVPRGGSTRIEDETTRSLRERCNQEIAKLGDMS
jgi:hypothetical protein